MSDYHTNGWSDELDRQDQLKRSSRMNHDFTISFQGTISILYPKSTAAVEWIDEHVPTYTAWCGGVVIDHRYVGDIVNGIHDAGLVIDGVVDTRMAS